MFPPRSASRQSSSLNFKSKSIPIILATNLATEFASLSSPEACPRGVYITPSEDTLLIWEGVMFIHDGPYSEAVLRFTINFELDFPRSRPVIKLGPDVYHPMVDPKKLIWSPRYELAKWQPGRHHVVHLIQALREDFNSSTIDGITEEEAINKQLFLLYKNSRHTFLSMTAQRSRQSSAFTTLYPASVPQEGKVPPSPNSSIASKTAVAPSTPTKKGHVRLHSGVGSLAEKNEEKEGMIRFKKLDPEEEEMLRAQLESRYSRQNT